MRLLFKPPKPAKPPVVAVEIELTPSGAVTYMDFAKEIMKAVNRAITEDDDFKLETWQAGHIFDSYKSTRTHLENIHTSADEQNVLELLEALLQSLAVSTLQPHLINLIKPVINNFASQFAEPPISRLTEAYRCAELLGEGRIENRPLLEVNCWLEAALDYVRQCQSIMDDSTNLSS